MIKNPTAVSVGDIRYDKLQELSNEEIKNIAKLVKEAKQDLAISIETEKDGIYAFNPDVCTILHTKEDGTIMDLGCGTFVFKASTGKKNSNHKVTIAPCTTGDYEIIPHHKDATANTKEIDAFMKKYVFKPYILGNNTVGVEINFNKEFYVPEKLEKAEDILRKIKELNSEFKNFEL